MRKSSFLTVGAALAIAVCASGAHAEDKAPKGAAGGVITADTVQIALRAPRPQVATEISKIAPTRPLAELKQPFLDRVAKVVDGAPF